MVNEIDAAWAAGFIDGEGSFCISTHGNREGVYQPSLQVGQVDKRPLEKLQNIFDCGGLKLIKKESPRKDLWVWTISSSYHLKNILPAIIPFLIVKKEEALIVYEACKLIGTGRGKHSSLREPGNLEKREFYANELKTARRNVYVSR